MRILLAEDQPSVRSALRLILEQQTDMSVIGEAIDADSLLKWLTANRADVVLLDWELPGISGKELITILHAVSPEIRIVVMDSSPQTRQPAMLAGAHDFINKSEPPEQLLGVLDNLKPKTGAAPKKIETNEGTREFGLSGFSRVNVTAALKLELVFSDTYHISTSLEDYECIRVEQNGETLNITRRSFNWRTLFRDQPRVVVATPELREIVATGACHVTAKGFHSSQAFLIELLGASQLETNDIITSDIRIKATGACRLTGSLQSSGHADIDISGASRIELTGSASNVSLHVTGASHAYLDRFPVQDVNILLSGASHGTIYVNGKMNANISGGSHLSWLGKPTLGDIEITGGSQIHRK